MKKFLIIDSHGLIHRAFHALPPLTTPDGKPIGAVYGVAMMILKIIASHKPDYVVAAFDRPEPTLRKQRVETYKANRPPADQNLVVQFEPARELFETLGIRIVDRVGYEADDIIASLVKKFKKDLEIVIVSGDLDTLQLVEPGVTVETPKKSLGDIVVYDSAAVEERFGVPPKLIPDYKGLVGDVSDNIPGVAGIGPKSAAELLKTFGSLESAIINADGTKGAGKKLKENKESAVLSKELATMDSALPITEDIEAFKSTPPDENRVVPLLERFGFVSLIKRMGFKKEAQENTNQATLCSQNIAWNWKAVLKNSTGKNFPGNAEDLSIMAWLIEPEKNQKLSFEQACLLFRVGPGTVNERLNELSKKLQEKITTSGLEYVYREIELPLIPVLAQMEQVGVLVNCEKLERLEEKIREEISRIEKEILKISETPINLNSPQQVGTLLFEKLGISTKGKKTPTGKIRTDRDTLDELRKEHPIVDLIISHREHSKTLSGFVSPIKELAKESGEVHTTFLQTAAATGRLASEQPNLQNIPQESPWSSSLREAFEARKGKTFLSFDYSQIELRVLAHVTKDIGLQEAFLGKRDIHTETAAKIFKIDPKDVSKSMRRTAKTLNFGIIYGMGVKAFAKASGLEIKEAQKIVDEYFRNFSKIKEWQNSIILNARTLGFVGNENGRKRYFGKERFPGEFDRPAINMPIQSFAADILKVAMKKTAKIARDYGAEILLSIHDELLFEVPDDMLKKIEPIIRNAMESSVVLSVPITVEAKVGKTWGSMDPIER